MVANLKHSRSLVPGLRAGARVGWGSDNSESFRLSVARGVGPAWPTGSPGWVLNLNCGVWPHSGAHGH